MLKIKLCYALTIYGLITGQEFGSFGAILDLQWLVWNRICLRVVDR